MHKVIDKDTHKLSTKRAANDDNFNGPQPTLYVVCSRLSVSGLVCVDHFTYRCPTGFVELEDFYTPPGFADIRIGSDINIRFVIDADENG